MGKLFLGRRFHQLLRYLKKALQVGSTVKFFMGKTPRLFFVLAFSLFMHLGSPTVFGHGGVAFEGDSCLISVNFLQAHFTVFQPETRKTREYCEDIPDVTRSVFVMEYLHDLLSEMNVDFRIIRDEGGLGRFADWEDIERIENIEAVTVFFEPERIEEGGFFSASHTFEERGTYIGIVTASHPTEPRDYNAVFFFRVGGRDWGTLPLFALVIGLLQVGYWISNGGFERRFGDRFRRT